jgi:hypothetical protein
MIDWIELCLLKDPIWFNTGKTKDPTEILILHSWWAPANCFQCRFDLTQGPYPLTYSLCFTQHHL